jgi:DNA repair exonuclease SbcCD ATPase subunit
LESLNSELKTTKDRIDELNSQDSLTIVEQEELEKLKQQEASLERQIKLQEKLAQDAQKTQATKIAKNYKKSTSDIATGPDLTQYRSWNENRNDNGVEYTTYRDEWVDADTWFNSITQGLDKTSDAY